MEALAAPPSQLPADGLDHLAGATQQKVATDWGPGYKLNSYELIYAFA